MSDTHAAESDAADDFDLTDVPMDGAASADTDRDDGDDDEGQGEQRSAARKDAPLAPEEIQRRYDNQRVALSEERRERRALQREIEALRRGERPAAAQEQRQQPQVEADIDPEEDPIGALKQMRAKVAAYEKAEQQENLTQRQRQDQERQFQGVESQLVEHEADFRDENPDYDDAAKHYAVSRATELLNFGLSPEQVKASLREEFVKLTDTAIKARKNPAAVIYSLAKGRGFGQAGGGDNPTLQPKPKAPGGKLEAIAKGQRGASPLSNTGGRAASGLDAATIANINIRDPKGGEAFDAAWDRMEAEARKNARGR